MRSLSAPREGVA